ncbi:MAG TPA: DUF4019 domain-containing protein [Rhodocyclaceae bacterium]|jgi:hypothetical protein|nr:DUF4019 domain-containing protein [Rhodocyclaceae bacterium]
MNPADFRPARRRFLVRTLRAASVAAALFGGIVATAHADDRDEATAVANDILGMLDTQEFERVWETHASAFLKGRLDRDSFIASVAIGRASLGKRMSSSVTGIDRSEKDADTGYEGVIYKVRIASTYGQDRYLEQIVLVREADGRLRLAGLWGRLAPQP